MVWLGWIFIGTTLHLVAQVTQSGIVLTKDGKPVEGILVHIDQQKPVISGADGKFNYELPQGQHEPYDVRISKLGWTISSWEYRPDIDETSITIAESKVILSGKIEDNARQPISDAKISLNGAFIEATSNSNGLFSLVVPPGLAIDRKDNFIMVDGMGLPKESILLDMANGKLVIRMVAHQVFAVAFKNEAGNPLSNIEAQIGSKFYQTDLMGRVKINNQILTKNDNLQLEGWNVIDKKYDAHSKSMQVTVRQEGGVISENNSLQFNPVIRIQPIFPIQNPSDYPSQNNTQSPDYESDSLSFSENIAPLDEDQISHITLDEYIKKSQEHLTNKEHTLHQISAFKELVKSQNNLSDTDREKATVYLKYLYQSLGDAEKHLQIRDMAQELIEQLQGALIEKDETFTQAVQAMETQAAQREESFRKAMERQKAEFQRKALIYSALIGLMAGLAILMILLMRRSRKHKREIESKNNVLEKSQRQVLESNEELKQRNEEIRAQSEHLRRLNEEVTRHNRNMTAGIRYAQTIQSAILPAHDELQQEFSDFFILYKPKDIVSGDFYWMARSKDRKQTFVAAVDCTGHGVPGAFMSMIGTNILNTIINNEHIYQPKEILERLNQKIRVALKQDQKINDDGMDLCLCGIEKIDDKTSKITFTGAKRPLFYATGNPKTLQTLKGDNKSIGGRQRSNKLFTHQEIILQKGDILYLTTDGLIDQSSPKHVKFGTKGLIELLTANATRPLDIQQRIFEDALKNHQQNEKQRDDITMIGIKI